MNQCQLTKKIMDMDEEEAKCRLLQLVGLMFVDHSGMVNPYKEWDEEHEKLMKMTGKNVIGRI